MAEGLPPITAEKIVAAALELTRAHGLDNWSIRQLSGALDVWPGVIYHHIGDRDAVVAEVTDAVVAAMPVPDRDLPWRQWFTELLVDGRAVMRQHPGVARRMCLVGPTVPAALPAIDTGVHILERAGFGADAAPVYRYLFDSAFLLVASEDDRAATPAARYDPHDVLAAYEDSTDHPGLASAARYARYTRERAAGGRTAEDAAAAFHAFTVARALDGAEALLPR
ncbi:TetR/AcrR family transcriptional regulator [Kitasatospora sp. NBC_00458]|uniref:TetR/AcrR family transcriptional regulator n=1 Tax=Kitasatospora sp. NBC_00458 TaxID=2903568 RepID=UPI002E18A78A